MDQNKHIIIGQIKKKNCQGTFHMTHRWEQTKEGSIA